MYDMKPKASKTSLAFFYFHFLNPSAVKHIFLVLFLTGLVAMASAQSYSVETVPNTKLVNNSYVSNPDNIINSTTVSQIDSILNDLESKSTAQVAVVLLTSIGEADIFDFSQELFLHWGIGQKQNNNGLLILMVLDQRTVRFHTGDGIEAILPDATCKDIQREYMIPYFKEGNYDEAMLAGIQAVAAVLNNPESRASESSALNSPNVPLYNLTIWVIAAWVAVALITFFVKRSRKSFIDNSVQGAEMPKAQFTSGLWFLWFILVPAGYMIALTLTDNAAIFFGGLYAYMGGTAMLRKKMMDHQAAKWLVKKDYQAIYNYYQDKQSLFSTMRFIFPLPFAFLYGAYKQRMLFYRNHPRDCKQCGGVLTKLDEHGDDKFLSKGQLIEENLKSVDYDVWLCKACQATESLIYPNSNSKYTSCPKCNFKTYHVVSNRTLRSATEYSEGQGEEIKACKHCAHRDVRKYTIAKIVKSSSSSSSSSSGGSWGGGSSSGGGASSSW